MSSRIRLFVAIFATIIAFISLTAQLLVKLHHSSQNALHRTLSKSSVAVSSVRSAKMEGGEIEKECCRSPLAHGNMRDRKPG
ncbi:hypothetical protein AAMO2058_000112600 [Amorphochlora amoebiformis]